MVCRLLLASVAIGAIVGLNAPAHATAITQGASFTEYWDIAVSGHPDLTATAAFANFNFVSPTQVQFTLDVTNTTNNTGVGAFTSDRFTSFGWDTNPATATGTDASTVFATLTNTTLSGVTVNVCLYGGTNCNGGANGGLQSADLATASNPSTTGDFLVTLTFGTVVPSLDFSNFYGKFQTNVTSYEAYATNTPPTSVPEPTAIALFGASLVGLGLARRKKVA